MRFLVLVKPGFDTIDHKPDAELVGKMGKFNEEMAAAGVMLAADGLHPTTRSARIRYPGGRPTVIDGPFTETKELVGGFWIIQAKNRDEAIEWMKRAPFGETEEIEIREIYETDDFLNDLGLDLPEVRERELRLRAELGGT
jgi:hypothetical protein